MGGNRVNLFRGRDKGDKELSRKESFRKEFDER